MDDKDKIIRDLRNQLQVANITLKSADDLLDQARRTHRLGAQTGAHWVTLGAAIGTYDALRQRMK